MKKSTRFVLLAVLAIAGSARALGPVSLNLGVDGNTRYVWRAIPQSLGPVIEPLVKLGFHDFSISAWGNVPLTDSGTKDKLDELDLSLGWSGKLFILHFDPGISYFLYPTQRYPNTAEAQVKVSLDLGPLTPYTFHALDFMGTPGAYYGTLGLTYTRPFLLLFSTSTDLSVAWADAAFNSANMYVAKNALNSATLGLSLQFSPVKLFYVRAHGALNELLDSALRAEPRNKSTTWSVGLAVGVNL
jgi:hypothetical protein